MASERGISLVEVIIAFTVLLMVLVPVSYILTNALSQSSNAREKIAALSIAEQWIETLNNRGPTPPTDPHVGNPVTEPSQVEGGVTYHVSAVFNWATTTGHDDLCTSGTAPSVLNLSVTVTWGAAGTISDTTIIDFPAAAPPEYGFIGVQIDRSPTDSTPAHLATPKTLAGTPWGGGPAGVTRVTTVPVTLTPATRAKPTITAHPNTHGCAFVEVTPTTYTVTVGPDTARSTPFVGTAGLTETTVKAPTPVAVSVDQVVLAGAFLYDEGAYVDLSYPDSTAADGGVTCPDVQKFQCLVTGQAPAGAASDGSTGIVATASVLSGTDWLSVALPVSAGISRIESATCTTTTVCVGVGYGPSGAAAVTDTPSHPADWAASPLPSGLSALNEVQCPTTGVCLAIGTTSSGGPVVLRGKITAGSPATISWSPDTLPPGTSVTALTQVVCPGTSACLAIGPGSGGAVVLASSQSATPQTWVADTFQSGVSVSSITHLACPGTSACLAIGTGSVAGGPAGPLVLAGSQSATTQAWVADTFAAGISVSSLTQMACPGTSACLAIGTGSVAGGPAGPLVLAGSQSATTQAWVADTLPTETPPITSLDQLACGVVGTTNGCLAVAATDSGDRVVAGPAVATSHIWVADVLPTGMTSVTLTQLACAGGAPTCAAIGSSFTTKQAFALTGALSASTQTFHAAAFPPGTDPVFLSGIACFGTSPLTCVAPGASEGGALLLGDAKATSAGSPWTGTAPVFATPPGPFPGLVATGIAVSVAGAGGSYVACPATAAHRCATVGPLFPYDTGYSVYAGTCPSDVTAASVQAATVPGTTRAHAPKVTLPLGLLPLEVVNAAGQPVVGASVAIHSLCGGTETLTTGPDGIVAVAVEYQTYSITVNGHTLTATVGGTARPEAFDVTPTAVVVKITGVTPAPAPKSHPLPSPVVLVT